jgi:hypothetical protein
MLVAPEDLEEFVRSIESVIKCPELRFRLGKAARTKAFCTMDVVSMIRAHEQLYEQVLRT